MDGTSLTLSAEAPDHWVKTRTYYTLCQRFACVPHHSSLNELKRMCTNLKLHRRDFQFATTVVAAQKVIACTFSGCWRVRSQCERSSIHATVHPVQEALPERPVCVDCHLPANGDHRAHIINRYFGDTILPLQTAPKWTERDCTKFSAKKLSASSSEDAGLT